MAGFRFAMRRGLLLALALICCFWLARQASAQIGSDRYAAIVMEARTGQILFAANPDELRYPASLTKMMTLYMAFEALKEGRISLNAPIRVSDRSARMPPSKLRLVPGSTLSVEEAMLALVTKSANDAASSLGEYLGGGDEARFAQMMTMRARSLGMTRTTFRNASGLPDADQVTTARDMALLGRRLMFDFPDRFSYFSVASFNFRGRTIFNHNRLLQEYEGADGIKTGYVNDSGFNLVASASRDGVRLVASVFGGATGRERDRHMMGILDRGFESMGIARRSMVARNHAPAIVGTAHAASRHHAQPATRVAAATPAARPATPRVAPATMASASPQTKLRLVTLPTQPRRVEPAGRLADGQPPRASRNTAQGDTERRTATATRTTTAAR